ncbi:DUF4405 domain-containing protein [Labilibacter sediminis]|nr:DUF4405 domain-containing protein [Labilibacter sediminis]
MANKESDKRTPSTIEKFLLHLHPQRIDVRAIKFTRTFGLGGISALLFVILCLTGLLLRFSYVPTVADAYDSILALENKSIFGKFIRSLHYLSAVSMIIISFLHLIRVYYSQSIFKKRAENWIYGLIMMLMVFAASFTGYLLPWDQLAYWAVTVITQIIEYIPLIGHSFANTVRGGTEVNGNTLLNFYSLHTGILPILFIVLMGIHFWLVRKAGGVALPQQEEKVKVKVFPNLVWKEVMTTAIVVAVLFVLAAVITAPLLEQANPHNSPNPSKAPWYFLGAQELLLHLHPVFSAVIIPLAAGIYFFALPYFRYTNLNIGVWFNSNKGKRVVVQSATLSFVFTFILIYLLEHFLHFDIWLSGWHSWLSTGLIPFILYVAPVTGALLYWRKKHMAQVTELFMAITTIILSSYICMMLVSLLLRGEGMLLIF